MASMTYEEARKAPNLMEAFGILLTSNLCHGCIHKKDCPTLNLVQEYFPSDSIEKCKFYEAWFIDKREGY